MSVVTCAQSLPGSRTTASGVGFVVSFAITTIVAFTATWPTQSVTRRVMLYCPGLSNTYGVSFWVRSVMLSPLKSHAYPPSSGILSFALMSAPGKISSVDAEPSNRSGVSSGSRRGVPFVFEAEGLLCLITATGGGSSAYPIAARFGPFPARLDDGEVRLELARGRVVHDGRHPVLRPHRVRAVHRVVLEPPREVRVLDVPDRVHGLVRGERS